MTYTDPTQEPRLPTRRSQDSHHPHSVAGSLSEPPAPRPIRPSRRHRVLQALFVLIPLILILAGLGVLYARHWVRTAATDSLPQLDGSLTLQGLSAPATVMRDPHGVPHIQAQTLDDLILAQGFVTAQDRLFQMDALRRHAAGDLAEIFGASLIGHDRLQRTLQIRAAADRAITAMPPAQLHLLEVYAKGVNAGIQSQSAHLPIEFRVLRYTPAPWTPRDSILVALAMFEDLTNNFPVKLARESLTARLPQDLAPDLYPVGSWRDHPPTAPVPDLTIPGAPFEQVPLDESQAHLSVPTLHAPFIAPHAMSGSTPGKTQILASLSPLLDPCSDCTPGSNNWAVSGVHTASGKPLLSNDMHLSHTLPGIWYEADLQAQQPTSEPFHVAGVSLPGLPGIIVGHNAHIAWGITNLEGDAQDVYIEQTRNENREFQSTDGTWQPIVHLPEHIRVSHGSDVNLDVLATRHGDSLTPILNPALTPDVLHGRTLSLRWTIYDPANLQYPFLDVNSAHDWLTFLAAFHSLGGPTQNVVYADDQGHIGFHVMGRIPLRGSPQTIAANAEDLPASIALPDAQPQTIDTPTIAKNPSPLNNTDIQAPRTPTAALLSGPISPVPFVPAAAHEWSGYIPFDKLPQVFDPPGGVIASANARTAPDDYPYPITLNWAAPYRNERIWKLLAHRTGLTPADMLAIQTDIYSDFDHVLAQRLAYALDHSQLNKNPKAADLLRSFNGRMTIDSPAATIVSAVHSILWPMLLAPHLDTRKAPSAAAARDSSLANAAPKTVKKSDPKPDQINALYSWGERDYALEQILVHSPPRWLPPAYATWDDFLADAVNRGIAEARAPADLSTWKYGRVHTLDIEHPLFEQSKILRNLLGHPTGTGPQPQSGDGTTIKQVGGNFRPFGPSERFTADLGNPDNSTLNIVLGQSANPASPWFLDQFPLWLKGTTLPFPFTTTATTHTLTLTPR